MNFCHLHSFFGLIQSAEWFRRHPDELGASRMLRRAFRCLANAKTVVDSMLGRTRVDVFRRKGSLCFWVRSNNSGLMLLFWCTFSSVCSFFPVFSFHSPDPDWFWLTSGSVYAALLPECWFQVALSVNSFFKFYFTFSWKFYPSLSRDFWFVVLVLFSTVLVPVSFGDLSF